VQCLAAKLGRCAAQLGVSDRPSVERIAENWVPVLGEVYADLMGPPCLETATNQRTSVQKLDRFEVCDRPLPTVAARGELFSMGGVSSVERVIRDRLRGPAKGNREIRALEGVLLKHLDQPLMRCGCLGDDHHPAGVLVEAVDDSRAYGVRSSLNLAVMEQRVDECPVRMTGRGMNHEARRLVEDQQMGVLEQNLQGNVLGLGVHGSGWGRVNRDLGTSHRFRLTRDDLAGLLDAPLLDPALRRARTRSRRSPPSSSASVSTVGAGADSAIRYSSLLMSWFALVCMSMFWNTQMPSSGSRLLQCSAIFATEASS